MLRKREWTDAEHELLAEWLSCNTPTVEMAKRFGISAPYLRKHLNDIGLKPPGWKSRYRPNSAVSVKEADAAPPSIPESRCQNWWPLPAGHPESWGAISTERWPGATP